jgi:3'(2'), 5'-bisphosphate nucleotidase
VGSFFVHSSEMEPNRLSTKYKIAQQAAIDACKEILSIYHLGFDTNNKEDGSPVTTADLRSSEIISAHLEKTGIPIIGEERKNTPFPERKLWVENWCVDPLDGTKEFIKRNGEFCVNIAHVENGKAVFGLIAEPCKGRMIFGGSDFGVYLWDFENDSKKEHIKELTPILNLDEDVVWIASRSHEGADADWVGKLSKPFRSVKKTPKGSAIKFFDLALGLAHIYPRFAPTMEWDIAAGQAILEALGGTIISTENGQPLTYNKDSLFNPFFVAKTSAFLIREKKFSSLHSI